MAVTLDHVPEKSDFYANLVADQKFALVDSFTLDSGEDIISVPVAYKTWGHLNENCDNTIVLCHALSGSSDADDWWGPLMGPGRAFDYGRFFIFCGNILGSPYGSASPLTINPTTGLPYGPKFPETTIRDDIRIHKLVLDRLGVRSIAAVIGGSMGGMATLEWSLCTSPGFVKNIIPITTSLFHSAWGIAWGEAQRQCIYADLKYAHGYYTPLPHGQPKDGLGAARMVGMLTYRSFGSFETRFGRRPAKVEQQNFHDKDTGLITPSPSDIGCDDNHLDLCSSSARPAKRPRLDISSKEARRQSTANSLQPRYAAQSYMQYQADKFLRRFDANCYVHLTRKMDSHDVTRGRLSAKLSNEHVEPTTTQIKEVLRSIPTKALVVSVATDVLFNAEQQIQIAECLPDATFLNLESPDGHDGFLLEFNALAVTLRDA